jgi:hypothetical protein
LHSFPPGVGRDVALSTVKHVARSHGVNVPGSDMGTESSILHSDKDVRWTMEVRPVCCNVEKASCSVSDIPAELCSFYLT